MKPRRAQIFSRGKLAMKTNTKYFKAVAADMKLEQSIQH